MHGNTMLRVEMNSLDHMVILKLEGRLTGEGADHVRTLVTRCPAHMKLMIDLTDVTFIDSVGEEALSFFRRFGGEFVAKTSYSLDICERLQLPLAQNGAEPF
jgi:anti-anti-sigma factor